MPNIELLNNHKHKQLRVDTAKFYEHGCQVGNAMIMPSEFSKVQREYPIFFRKDPKTGQFYSSCLLGFAADENLFLKDNVWLSNYMPLVLARGPFLIGYQEQEENGARIKAPVVHIDMDDPRINDREGEPIFTDEGEHSPYISQVANLLMGIHQGVEDNKTMIALFMEFKLIESVNMEIELNNGQKIQLSGIYTINEETLAKLDSHALVTLNESGYLRHAFSVVNSMDSVQTLINHKNALSQ